MDEWKSMTMAIKKYSEHEHFVDVDAVPIEHEHFVDVHAVPIDQWTCVKMTLSPPTREDDPSNRRGMNGNVNGDVGVYPMQHKWEVAVAFEVAVSERTRQRQDLPIPNHIPTLIRN